MPIKTIPFDASELLDTPEAQAEFIRAALESGDRAHIGRAIAVVACARLTPQPPSPRPRPPAHTGSPAR